MNAYKFAWDFILRWFGITVYKALIDIYDVPYLSIIIHVIVFVDLECR